MYAFVLILIVTPIGSDEPTGRLALGFELMDVNMYDAIKGNSIRASLFSSVIYFMLLLFTIYYVYVYVFNRPQTPFAREQSQVLHVSAAESYRSHAQERHFPQRY